MTGISFELRSRFREESFVEVFLFRAERVPLKAASICSSSFILSQDGDAFRRLVALRVLIGEVFEHFTCLSGVEGI